MTRLDITQQLTQFASSIIESRISEIESIIAEYRAETPGATDIDTLNAIRAVLDRR